LIQTLNIRVRKVFSGLDEHTREVVFKSSSSLLVRVLGIVAAFGVSVALGRTLGATGLGIINLAQQIATLLLVVTMLGMDNVLIKNVAIAYGEENPKGIADSLYTASVINGSLATALTVVGILASPWLARRVFHSPALEIPLIVTLAVLVPQTFARVFAASLNGFHKVWQSNLVNNTLSIWVVAVGLVVMHFAHARITVIPVAILYALGRLTVFFSMGLYQRKLFRYKGPYRMNARPMLKMALPLLLSSASFLVIANADGVMLGWLRSPHEVGLYSVAGRLAMMESVLLMVSNSAISPKLASLYAQGRTEEMEKMVKRVTGGLILVAVTSLGLFLLFGHTLLSLWGREFVGGYAVLVVLGIGQFFSISTGCCGLLLVLCGRERLVGYVSMACLILNLVLNYFLIRAWGALGAAAATTITVAAQNLANMMLTRREIGFFTIPV